MNGSINTARESGNSLQAHMNIIADCIGQIGQALTLTWDGIREYAGKVMSSFGGGHGHDNFLMVDRVVVMIKKLMHHLREMRDDLTAGGQYTQDRGLVSLMQDHIASLETAQRNSGFLYNVFGWALQEPKKLMKEMSEEYQIG